MKKLNSILGIIGGALWISIAFYPPKCVPVTNSSEVFCNRLWTPALFGMLLGMIGLFRLLRPLLTKAARGAFVVFIVGFALMFTGNFVEYWFLTGLPHQGPAGIPRGIFWMLFLLGALIMLISSIVIGYMMRTITAIPGWLKRVFLLVLPLTFVAGFIGLRFVGLPIGVLSILAGNYGLVLEKRDDQ